MDDGEIIAELQDKCDLLEKALNAANVFIDYSVGIDDIEPEILRLWNEYQAALKQIEGKQ